MAFEGKLTNEYVKVGELPVGWKWLPLDSVSEKITDVNISDPKH
jgi:hypothetical protein